MKRIINIIVVVISLFILVNSVAAVSKTINVNMSVVETRDFYIINNHCKGGD